MNKAFKFVFPCLLLALSACKHGPDYASGPDGAKVKELREKVKHIIVIYEENWSFDGLYGYYPDSRVNNLLYPRGPINPQVNRKGKPFNFVPYPTVEKTYIYKDNKITVDTTDYRFVRDDDYPRDKPYDMRPFIKGTMDTTGDLVHRYYTEFMQIDGGKMDKFVAWSDNPGLVMSTYSDTSLPEERLAWKYTLCDNFFHSAFGGSFLNHIWFIAAATPYNKKAPFSQRSNISSDVLKQYDKQYTPDGYAINTIYSHNHPIPNTPIVDSFLLPNIKLPTIGDRLNDAGQSWAWYSGGWDEALKGNDQGYFQYHHQPFTYFEKYKDGTENKKKHLKDEKDFFTALKDGNLPSVCFIKPLGINNEHPGYSSLRKGQEHADSIINQVMNSPYGSSTVIIIVYDEHGGRYDHVAPPKIDRWGPGSRVPCIVVSPYAKKHFVDSTQYETVSILKLIETMYDLPPLSKRDSAANNMLNTLEFK